MQLSVLAYNLGNLWRRLVLPTRVDSCGDQPPAAPRQDRRAVGQARPVLLAAAGRESSDPTPVRGDAAADLGAAGPGRLTGRRRTPAGDKPSAGKGVREMRWNRAISSRFQAGTGHGSGFQGAGWSAIRKSVAAGSRGSSIRVFGEGKSEIPVNLTFVRCSTVTAQDGQPAPWSRGDDGHRQNSETPPGVHC